MIAGMAQFFTPNTPSDCPIAGLYFVLPWKFQSVLTTAAFVTHRHEYVRPSTLQ
eukprot:m.692934 g.692934  ORF g.692934 m.692934 type:complete len:54 (+) comp22867_c0_seq20:4285-4446(+)